MATHHIETAIDIDAPAARVWAVLTDLPRMPSWNPFIRSISGDLREGAHLSVHLVPPGKSGMRFKPVILALRAERELRWRGRLLVPGLFDGEHYFLLDPSGAARTHFTQGEKFSGLLVTALRGMLGTTEAGFNAMNVALKREAEAK